MVRGSCCRRYFRLERMEPGQISKTALGVAIRRAAHQLQDHPPVLDDPIAVRLIGDGHPRRMERAMHKVARDFRAFMAVRSRYTEDQLAVAVTLDVNQYVILGAGLDTFAHRNPFANLRVFEVDFPATQAWKRSMLNKADIGVPDSLTYVPVDFEQHTLTERLDESGFDSRSPAFFSWLGVVPYLTLEAFRSTLFAIARLPGGTALSFDYALAPETLGAAGRIAFDRLTERVAAAGEPLQLFFTPDEMGSELERVGFKNVEQRDYKQLNEMYFKNRADGLRLSAVGLARLVTVWV